MMSEERIKELLDDYEREFSSFSRGYVRFVLSNESDQATTYLNHLRGLNCMILLLKELLK